MTTNKAAEAKTMNKNVVIEDPYNETRAYQKGQEAMREACMQACEEYADRCSQHSEYEIILAQAAYALSENIRAINIEEVLK